MAVVRHLGGLQIDPTRAVERTHLLVLWSRLGAYDRTELDRLLWQERRLFEYGAFIVPTERYPEQQVLMRAFGTGGRAWDNRAAAWVTENDAFRRRILKQLRRDGPLPSRAFTAGPEVTNWRSSGWTGGRNVGQMLELLWQRGEILISGRDGSQRLWDLAERVLPDWTPREELSREALLEIRAERFIRRLGLATRAEIATRLPLARPAEGRAVVDRLESNGRLRRVEVGDDDGKADALGPGPIFVHVDDLDALGEVEHRAWQPHTTLLSPFDRLIYDRDRTERLFGFRYRLEMYVPKERRKFGYFVLPILHGDRLIGRVDPLMDRKRAVLTIRNLAWEPDAPRGAETMAAVRGSIQDLGRFLGAGEVEGLAGLGG
ncbi:crosslink repair DNA glycosylase YcaQ family protein [soil metagenome]